MNALIRDIRRLNFSGLLIVLMLLTWLISLFSFMNARIETNDPLGYYAQTVALAERMSLDLSLEAKQIDQIGWTHNLKKDSITGKIYSQYPLGVSLMQLPFYYFGKVLAGTDSKSPWRGSEVWWVCAGSALYGLAGVLILLILGLKLWGTGIAVRTTILIFLGTALYYYMFFQPGMSHSYAFFLSSAFLIVWLGPILKEKKPDWCKAADRSLLRSFTLGVLLGMSFLLRYLDGLLALLLVFECLYLMLSGKSHSGGRMITTILPGYLAAFIGFVLTAGIQFVAQYLKHNRWSILNHYDGGFERGVGAWKWLEVLFSSHHGLFYWHPLLILGLLGFIWSLISRKTAWRVPGIWFLALLLIYAVVVAAWGRFAFGANSFGHRFFISLYPLFFLFIGFFVEFLSEQLGTRFNIFLTTVAFLFLAFNASVMLQFATGVIPPDAPVTWAEMLSNTWLELPGELNRRLRP